MREVFVSFSWCSSGLLTRWKDEIAAAVSVMEKACTNIRTALFRTQLEEELCRPPGLVLVSKTWVWAAVPHCWFGGLRFLRLQGPPSSKRPVGNLSFLILHYLWETPGFLYTQAAEGRSGHGVGVLEAGVMPNILAFCGKSDKSQSRMEDEKASWQYVNIPDVRLVHANVWCTAFMPHPCPLLFGDGSGFAHRYRYRLSCICRRSRSHAPYISVSLCWAHMLTASHLSGYLLPSFRVLSNLL